MAETSEAAPAPPETTASSFSKSLFLGQIPEEMVFPYPRPPDEEVERIRDLIARLRAFCSEHVDSREIDRAGWIDDKVVRGLGELGAMGLYVPAAYGGAGLSQTGYARVFEALGQIDGSLSVLMGVHQSIGMKGIALFGSDEQKERYLPDLAAGRKLAGFALTEPGAGSDAYDLKSRAVLQPDGSYVLNGEKAYIGNGGRGEVFCVFARIELERDGKPKDSHIALIVERGMKGFESGPEYDKMGLRGASVTPLTFKDLRVPPENVLGEPGEGFRIAVAVLNNGRMSLGTGTVGAAKRLLDLAIDHVTERKQFGRPIADFELVEEKIGWMVSYLFGLESMCYLSTGLVDAGVPDYSLESAICKVAGTEFVWYQANRAMQLRGGGGYMRTEPYEQIMRDIRIFPIFEGTNDILRCFIALSGLKPLAEELGDIGKIDLGDPIHTIGVVADYVAGRIQRELRPDSITKAHPDLSDLAGPVGDQVKRLRSVSEGLLREHRSEIQDREFAQKRLAHAVMDIYAQIATLSRATSIFEEQGAEASGQERYIAETFCTRAQRRVEQSFDQIEENDDERMHSIARLAYRRGEYGYAFFED